MSLYHERTGWRPPGWHDGDARARELQPVAARLGDRFLPWQLEQGVEESREARGSAIDAPADA
ncbi:hypothetical protein [Sorangium sp. So ce861]|uniref:hypothetical protein n=1 Tax=Sorangium sp. So ce861 TaxID=3133323 RepID=UPI003F5F2474